MHIVKIGIIKETRLVSFFETWKARFKSNLLFGPSFPLSLFYVERKRGGAASRYEQMPGRGKGNNWSDSYSSETAF